MAFISLAVQKHSLVATLRITAEEVHNDDPCGFFNAYAAIKAAAEEFGPLELKLDGFDGTGCDFMICPNVKAFVNTILMARPYLLEYLSDDAQELMRVCAATVVVSQIEDDHRVILAHDSDAWIHAACACGIAPYGEEGGPHTK